MFIEEITKKLRLDNPELTKLKTVVLDKSAILVEGHKGLLFFSKEEIKMRIPNGTVTVAGENLSLREVSKTEAMISGKILRVEYI